MASLFPHTLLSDSDLFSVVILTGSICCCLSLSFFLDLSVFLSDLWMVHLGSLFHVHVQNGIILVSFTLQGLAFSHVGLQKFKFMGAPRTTKNI